MFVVSHNQVFTSLTILYGVVLIYSTSSSLAFTSSQLQRQQSLQQQQKLSWRTSPVSSGDGNIIRQESKLRSRIGGDSKQLEESLKCSVACPEFDDDVIEDRREAIFITLGSIWAATSPTTGGGSVASGIAAAVGQVLLFQQQPAYADYGKDANIALPNPYQYLLDREESSVSSTGSSVSSLYQGMDNDVLLKRIEKAALAMSTIPDLANDQKWSKVTGVLTGPMGDLIRSMNDIAKLSKNNTDATIKVFKKDLYAITDGVTKKDTNAVIKAHGNATNDLLLFLKAL